MTTRHHAPEVEADLVNAWKAGDRRAGDRLLSRYVRELDGHFYFKVGRSDADELRQQTLLRVSQAIAKFRGESSFRTFLYSIAHRTLCDFLRARRTGRGRFDAAQCSLEEVLGEIAVPEFDLDSRELLAALRALPVVQQQVFELKLIRGFTYEQIAQVVAVRSPVTLRTSLHAACRKLRALLGEPDGRHRGIEEAPQGRGDAAVTGLRLGPRYRRLAALIATMLSVKERPDAFADSVQT